MWPIVGSYHAHADAGSAGVDSKLRYLVGALGKKFGAPGKINLVTREVSGPQRQLLQETYDEHAPGKFEKFTTSYFDSRTQALHGVKYMLGYLQKRAPESVIEVEYVDGVIDGGKEAWAKGRRPKPFSVKEVGRPAGKALYELHHAVDIHVPEADLPSDLLGRLELSFKKAGLVFGGLFHFEEDGKTAIRTNGFFKDRKGMRGRARSEHAAIHRILQEELGLRSDQYGLWSVLEKSLLIRRPATGSGVSTP
jgi:hypothetical protein